MSKTGDEKPIYLVAIHTPEGEVRWLSTSTATRAKAALAFGTREDAESHARADSATDVYEIVEFARVPAPSKE